MIALEDIRRAAAALKGAIQRTPLQRSATLSRLTGAEIFLKFENLQFTASFKERGALWKLLSLPQEARARGVIAMSAGNHAQGVAYHAARLGIPATIVMPEGTPFVKIKHTKDHGARVLIEGATLSEAAARAHAIAEAEGLTFVHPYDDERVMTGQGTAALEILEDAPDLDVLVVPIGGGGLISGIASAAKALKPEIEIVGVEARAYPKMYNAVLGHHAKIGGPTIAEGIAVKDPGKRCIPIIRDLVSDIVLVSEEQIEHAIALLLAVEKTVVEGAGAAGLAAVLAHPERFRGKRVGLILCGGNIDPRLLANVIMRDLAREGRILNLVIEIEDRPGLLAKIATLVGEAGGNILEVSHNRLITDLPAKNADLGMTIEARDAAHAAEIVAALKGAGYSVRAVKPAGH